jgi:fumarate hydratase, class I
MVRAMNDSEFHDLFPHAHADTTPWKKLSAEGVASGSYKGERVVEVAPAALTQLAAQAMVDCQHLLRPGHLQHSSSAASSTTRRLRRTTSSSPSTF